MLTLISLTIIPLPFVLSPVALNAIHVSFGAVLYMLVIINFSIFSLFSYSLAWYSCFLVPSLLVWLPIVYLFSIHICALNRLPFRIIFTNPCRVTFIIGPYAADSVVHTTPCSTLGAATNFVVQRLSLLPLFGQLERVFSAH